MSSSKRLASVTYPVPIAQEKKGQSTWTGNYSPQSLMSVANTGQGHSASIYLENHFSTQKLLKHLNTLRRRIEITQSFLQQTEQSSTILPKGYAQEWIESSGHTELITSIKSLSAYLKISDSYAYLSKKRRKKSSRSGKRSQGSR